MEFPFFWCRKEYVMKDKREVALRVLEATYYVVSILYIIGCIAAFLSG